MVKVPIIVLIAVIKDKAQVVVEAMRVIFDEADIEVDALEVRY